MPCYVLWRKENRSVMCAGREAVMEMLNCWYQHAHWYMHARALVHAHWYRMQYILVHAQGYRMKCITSSVPSTIQVLSPQHAYNMLTLIIMNL
jgi:hypothetical protein